MHIASINGGLVCSEFWRWSRGGLRVNRIVEFVAWKSIQNDSHRFSKINQILPLNYNFFCSCDDNFGYMVFFTGWLPGKRKYIQRNIEIWIWKCWNKNTLLSIIKLKFHNILSIISIRQSSRSIDYVKRCKAMCMMHEIQRRPAQDDLCHLLSVRMDVMELELHWSYSHQEQVMS